MKSETQQKTINISLLPNDILIEIILYLRPIDIWNFRFVCKRFNEIISSMQELPQYKAAWPNKYYFFGPSISIIQYSLEAKLINFITINKSNRLSDENLKELRLILKTGMAVSDEIKNYAEKCAKESGLDYSELIMPVNTAENLKEIFVLLKNPPLTFNILKHAFANNPKIAVYIGDKPLNDVKNTYKFFMHFRISLFVRVAPKSNQNIANKYLNTININDKTNAEYIKELKSDIDYIYNYIPVHKGYSCNFFQIRYNLSFILHDKEKIKNQKHISQVYEKLVQDIKSRSNIEPFSSNMPLNTKLAYLICAFENKFSDLTGVNMNFLSDQLPEGKKKPLDFANCTVFTPLHITANKLISPKILDQLFTTLENIANSDKDIPFLNFISSNCYPLLKVLVYYCNFKERKSFDPLLINKLVAKGLNTDQLYMNGNFTKLLYADWVYSRFVMISEKPFIYHKEAFEAITDFLLKNDEAYLNLKTLMPSLDAIRLSYNHLFEKKLDSSDMIIALDYATKKFLDKLEPTYYTIKTINHFIKKYSIQEAVSNKNLRRFFEEKIKSCHEYQKFYAPSLYLTKRKLEEGSKTDDIVDVSVRRVG